MRYVTTQDIVRTAEITLRQADHWIRSGYITPVDRDGAGTGVRREFTMDEFRVACHMANLVRCGFTPAAAAKMARGDGDALMKVDLTLSALRVSLGVTSSPKSGTM